MKGEKRRAGELEINVNVIDARTFAELDRYVKEKIAVRNGRVVGVDAMVGEKGMQPREGSAKKRQRT